MLKEKRRRALLIKTSVGKIEFSNLPRFQPPSKPSPAKKNPPRQRSGIVLVQRKLPSPAPSSTTIYSPPRDPSLCPSNFLPSTARIIFPSTLRAMISLSLSFSRLPVSSLYPSPFVLPIPLDPPSLSLSLNTHEHEYAYVGTWVCNRRTNVLVRIRTHTHVGI